MIQNLFKKREVMSVIIIKLMSDYVKEQEALLPIKLEDNIQEKYQELVSLGLGNTKNAQVLKARIEDYEKAEKIFKFIKELRQEFGPTSFLISDEQFANVRKKYKLDVGLLSTFTGVIPQKNIEEIARIKSHRNNFGRYFYVTKVIDGRSSSNEGIPELEKFLKDKYYLISLGRYDLDKFTYDQFLYRLSDSDRKKLKGSIWFSNLIDIYGAWTSGNDLLIAAPKKCFNEHFKVEKAPVDPIVFQKCPYGVVVHSIWGEEADDKTLQEYLNFNSKISC